jgi:hypothetical protein
MTDEQQALLTVISPIASDPSRRIYAVMDGARFDNLPAELANLGLAHRSLFRNVQDIELVKAGPWLIDPYHQPDAMTNVWGGVPSAGDITPAVEADAREALSDKEAAGPAVLYLHDEAKTADPVFQLEKVVQFTGGAPAVVFWVGEASMSESLLWQHLRTINMVLFPKSELDDFEDFSEPVAGSEGEALFSASDTHKMVVFRHADPNVLAQVLPSMNPAEFSRVLGPASAVCFVPAEEWRVEPVVAQAVKLADTPHAERGPLKLSVTTVRAIEVASKVASEKRIMDFLRSAAPQYTRRLSDEKLLAVVREAHASGQSVGVQSERSLGLFTLLSLMSGGELAKDTKFLNGIRRDPRPADHVVDEVYDQIAAMNSADIRALVP